MPFRLTLARGSVTRDSRFRRNAGVSFVSRKNSEGARRCHRPVERGLSCSFVGILVLSGSPLQAGLLPFRLFRPFVENLWHALSGSVKECSHKTAHHEATAHGFGPGLVRAFLWRIEKKSRSTTQYQGTQEKPPKPTLAAELDSLDLLETQRPPPPATTGDLEPGILDPLDPTLHHGFATSR